MYNFIEQSIRGGISMISNRYATNLPDIVGELRTHIIYLDANNLYGWALNQYLPTYVEICSGFPARLASISDTADTGYISGVSIHTT